MKKIIFWSVFLSGIIFFNMAASADNIQELPERMTMTLKEAVDIARQNNLNLANASLEVSKSAKDKKIADRAGYPEVSIEASYTRLYEGEDEQIPITGLGTIYFETPDSNFDMAVSASMPLYTGGRILAGRNQASIGQNLASQSQRATYGDIVLEVTTTFYDLLSTQEEVKITEEALEVSKRHLADVNSLLRQGLVARLDLIRTELDLAERERDLFAGQTRLLLAAERLSVLLFPDRLVSIGADGAFSGPAPLIPVEEWMGKALGGSPELVSARLNVDLAQAAVDASKAEGKAGLALFGNYGSSGEDFTIDSEDRYWNTGVSVSIPLYQGGRTTAAVERETKTRIQAENFLKIALREIHRAIVETTVLMKLSASEYAVALKAIEAGEENLRVTTLKYKQGLVINTDVIDAQLSLTRSRLLRITALKNYHTNRARLFRTVGSTEEIP